MDKILLDTNVLENENKHLKSILSNYNNWLNHVNEFNSKILEMNPQQLFTNIVEFLELTFADASISLHLFNDEYLHLISKSKELDLGSISTICKEKIEMMVSHFDEQGLFFNNLSLIDHPHVVFLIKYDQQPYCIISIFNSDLQKVNQFDYQQFVLLKQMISTYIKLTLDYEKITCHDKFVYGTRIYSKNQYAEIYKSLLERSNKQNTNFLILRLHQNTNIIELDHKLGTIIRKSDIVGFDGEYVYVLLVNSTKKNYDAIYRRFERNNLTFDVIDRLFYEPA